MLDVNINPGKLGLKTTINRLLSYGANKVLLNNSLTQTDAEAPRMRVLRAARPARTLGLRPALRVARRTQTLRMNSCVLEFPSCADKNASNRFALRGAPWNAYSGSQCLPAAWVGGQRATRPSAGLRPG